MPFATGVLALLDERRTIQQEIGAAKGRLSQVDKRIIELVKPAMDSAYAREGKPGGTVRFTIDNHLLKAVVTKRVEWDSDMLSDIASKLPSEAVSVLFKIDYSVPEAIFKNVAEPELKAKLVGARTVKYSEAKITLDDEA